MEGSIQCCQRARPPSFGAADDTLGRGGRRVDLDLSWYWLVFNCRRPLRVSSASGRSDLNNFVHKKQFEELGFGYTEW